MHFLFLVHLIERDKLFLLGCLRSDPSAGYQNLSSFISAKNFGHVFNCRVVNKHRVEVPCITRAQTLTSSSYEYR